MTNKIEELNKAWKWCVVNLEKRKADYYDYNPLEQARQETLAEVEMMIDKWSKNIKDQDHFPKGYLNELIEELKQKLQEMKK